MQNIAESFAQNNFSRSLHNEAKLGAYYTDVGHCRRIGRLFEWPEEEVCVLEPSIGDGKAVCAITHELGNRTIFGVEINRKTYEEIKGDGAFAYLLNEDFLHGIKVSRSAFSFCFANPPYGEDQDGKERLEKQFIEKIFPYMKQEAVFVLVVPYHALMDDGVFRTLFSRFHPIHTFRFDDREYAKYKQIAVVTRRRRQIGCRREELAHYREFLGTLEKIPYLPGEDEPVEERVSVPPSSSGDIEYFAAMRFDSAAAGAVLAESPLYSVIGEHGMQKPYLAMEIGQPPVPLKKDMLYLAATSGVGQGIVGEEGSHDVHLQRGVVKVEKSMEVDGESDIMTEHSYTAIALNIVENDGTITTLS